MFDYAGLRSYHREEFSEVIKLLEKLGYNELGLYIEGSYIPDGVLGAPREGVITQQIADEIINICAAHNMAVLPMTNVLFHMEQYFAQERYAYLRRKGQYSRYLINFEHEDAVPFAMKIIRDVADMFHTRKIHIGLDEFPYNKDEIPAIGKYISEVISRMLSEGLLPAVWGDIFWMEQSITQYLPRETEIHDWNYYGHRPDSIRYFREAGFEHIIAVPSDNGWEGFTGIQRATGYMRARTDMPVEPGEIEAFLDDAVKEGAEGGMVANWGNTIGRSLWSALAPVARAGLWMQGKWDYNKSEEEQVEYALFGRITPYTKIVLELRKLQKHHTDIKCHIRMPQDALYRIESMLQLLNKPMGYWDETILLYEQALQTMKAEIGKWQPETLCEEYACGSLSSVIENVHSAYCLMRLSQAQTIYREAAMKQFSDTDAYISLLEKFASRLTDAADGLKRSIESRAASIENTGITRQDFLWQKRLIEHLERVMSRLDEYRQNPTRIKALCGFTELIYCWDFVQGGLMPQ